MIDFEDVFRKLFKLPEFDYIGGNHPELSYPLLREVDGTLYVVYMGYSYGDTYPDLLFLYNTETKEAQSEQIGDGLKRIGISKFPVESRDDVPFGDEEFLENFFWESIPEGKLDHDAFLTYISTIVNTSRLTQGKYYWAFA